MTPQDLELRLAAGFVVLVSAMVALDLVGTYLYHKGIVKPFYLFDRRIHHRSFVLTLIPAVYVGVSALVYLHYFRILWSSFWPSVEITLFLGCACLLVDFAFDSVSSPAKRRALLHHEWVYLVVPAYAFTHIVALV